MDNDIVFDPQEIEKDTLSLAGYNFCIGLFLIYGFFINALECHILSRLNMPSFDWWVGALAYLACIGLGSFFVREKAGALSTFVGYNFFVVPVGFSVSLAVSSATLADISEAAALTSFITFTMMLGGTIFPKFFMGLGRMLFLALVSFVIAQIGALFIFGSLSNIWNIVAVFIFALYIGFDWAVALVKPKTVKSAIRVALELYLDIINIFLSLLRSRR